MPSNTNITLKTFFSLFAYKRKIILIEPCKKSQVICGLFAQIVVPAPGLSFDTLRRLNGRVECKIPSSKWPFFLLRYFISIFITRLLSATKCTEFLKKEKNYSNIPIGNPQNCQGYPKQGKFEILSQSFCFHLGETS